MDSIRWESADHYEILGVDRDASTAVIRAAYRSRCKVVHPDAGGDVGAFARLNEAYDTLSDPISRASYDRLLAVRSA